MVRIKRSVLKKTIILAIVICLIVCLAVIAVLKRNLIRDFFRGLSYKPTAEMTALKSNLDLTDSGSLIFNASWPELNEKDDFNNNCRTIEASTAILGCFTDEKIYVYNITDKRLDGIREATLAHELLHAVYTRMDESERESLKTLLDQVYKSNKEVLGDELDIYPEEEQYEELYVRAGTEIAKLPAELERHFEKYFNDQDKIAKYYNNYASVFKELNQKIKELGEQLDSLSKEIESLISQYEQKLTELNAEVSVFNNCAATVGCFSSEWDFYTRRNELVYEQNELNEMYDEISNLINTYNEIVVEYNENVIYSKTLNGIINSMSQPEEIK